MKSAKTAISLMIAFLLLVSVKSYSGTTVDTSGALDITSAGVDEITIQFQDILDDFGPAISNAYALANMGGYPLGKSYIGDSPHLFFGFSLNAGLSNMQFFDSDADVEEGVYPAVAINPAIYFGMGLAKGLDFMVKAFVYSDGFYRPPVNFEFATLTKLNIYSFGGRVRYNYLKEKTLLPGLFGFGGVTFSGGVDFMYGTIRMDGDLSLSLTSIEVDVGGTDTPIDIDFNSYHALEVKWFIISVDTRALAYLDFFWIFDLYTGVGLALNFGSFGLDISAPRDPAQPCTVTTENAAYKAANAGSGDLGTITVVSDNKYRPYIIVPTFIIGFDINLFVIRLAVETMVNLRNGSDVNVQLGTRFQF